MGQFALRKKLSILETGGRGVRCIWKGRFWKSPKRSEKELFSASLDTLIINSYKSTSYQEKKNNFGFFYVWHKTMICVVF